MKSLIALSERLAAQPCVGEDHAADYRRSFGAGDVDAGVECPRGVVASHYARPVQQENRIFIRRAVVYVGQ